MNTDLILPPGKRVPIGTALFIVTALLGEPTVIRPNHAPCAITDMSVQRCVSHRGRDVTQAYGAAPALSSAYLQSLKSRYAAMPQTGWFRRAYENRTIGDILNVA